MFPKFGNKVIAALAVAAGLALSASAMAANTQSAPQNGASSSAAAPQVSQREMKKFADINVKAAEIRSQYSGQLKSAKDPKKVTALHKKMNQEILLALRNEGLSVKQYGQVLRAVQQNPQVKKQVIQMMRNEQAGSKADYAFLTPQSDRFVAKLAGDTAMGGMSLDEIRVFLAREFPQGVGVVERAGDMSARLRLSADRSHLRPGGTISGPTLMGLADCAVYVAILAEIGAVALAVTINLNINFFRKAPGDQGVIADARLFKLGRRLAVGEVTLYSDASKDAVAHATCTYSIPPSR